MEDVRSLEPIVNKIKRYARTESISISDACELFLTAGKLKLYENIKDRKNEINVYGQLNH